MQSELRSQELTHLGHAAWLEQIPHRARYRKEWFNRRQSVDPVRVFVVDADLGRSARVAAQIHAIGSFETRIAATADSALRVAADFLPNIVLLNIDLADGASYHLATNLRWQPRLVGLRLIALTSDIPGADRRRAFDAGFEQYLTIPVRQSTLESALRASPQHGNQVKRRGANRRRH